jgi:polyribonucleotide 5'-hydroxyl-kinase
LVRGTAEVFGTEVARNQSYSLCPRMKLAIFTWHSCTVRVEGEPQVAYISEETPMIMYLNTHIAVDQLRHRREKEGQIGPRVMLAGATDVGKSTLCRLLLSYAARLGRQPCLVDCDVGQGSVSIPGSLCVLSVERPADIETGEFNKQASLVYSYGATTPSDNFKLYTTVVTSMAAMFRERCTARPATKSGGCVINTCGWVEGQGYNALVHVAEAFEVDVVLVLDHERLTLDLQRDLPKTTEIVPLPKSGGVVARTREFRRRNREDAVREYFYGKRPHLLSPFSFEVAFSDIQICKIGAPAVPQSALPLGMEKVDGSVLLVHEEPTKQLSHTIVSLSMANSTEEDVASTPSAGFLCITDVDMEAKTLTVLSPAPHPLPRKILIRTNLQFMDFQ